MVIGSRIVKGLKGTGSGYWMALPALLAIVAIVAYPLAFATYYSFRRVLPNLAGEFIGLENYSQMLEDPDFAEALKTTLVFTAASGGLSFLAGFGLALLLSKPFFGRGALAAAAFLPWVFPPVAVATFGRLALFSGVGPLSSAAEVLGFGNGELLLVDQGVLLSVAVVLDVWRTAPFVALLLLAALRTIPGDVYEAARVDGAGALQRFFSITLPLLKPALLVVLLLRLLDAFRVFDLFRVLGADNLASLSTYVYQDVMLSQINFGLGNAAAVFVFLCAFLASLFFAFVLRAQASTGLAHSGLQRDAQLDGGGTIAGRGYGRSGLTLGALGGMLSALFLAPLVWVFWVSVTHAPGDGPGGAVTGPSLLAYPMVLFDTSLTVGLANSAIIAGSTAVLTLVLACPAGYALARFGLPYANGAMGVMLAVAFFPPVAVLVPLLVQLRETGLVGTQLGAIVPDTVFFLPFAIWLLATFFRELPAEVEDAAKVDGAGRLRVLTSVVMPLAAPSLFATGAFVFVLSWNELIFASTFTLSEYVRPVTVVLSDLVAEARLGFPGPLAAASLVAALPPVVLFLVFRGRIFAGLTGGETLGGAVVGHTSRAPTATLQRAVLWVATVAFLLAGAWAASLFVRHGLAALAFPYPLNYGEGPLLDQAARLTDLKNIYPADLSKPPYVVSNYPLLFVLLQVPFVWIFGPEFLYGRAISLASTIWAAGLIAATLNAFTRDKTASAAGGLTFLAVPFVLHWSSLDRVDMMGLALSWGGLYAVVRRPDRRNALLVAVLFFVAAIYTRQTYALAAPLAAFAWLLAGGHGRRALALATLTGGLSMLLLGALSALTGGGFFFHTVSANVNEFRWEQVSSNLSTMQGLMPLLLVEGVAFVVLGLRSRPPSWWLVGAYLAGSAVAALLIGKVGSDVNYLLELSAALSLAAGALIARYGRLSGTRCALLLALAVQVAILVQASQYVYAGLQADVIAQRTGLARLEGVVEGSKGPVLADEYAGLLSLDGRRIYLQPFEMTQLQRDGRWDQGPFLRSIKRRKFPVILIWKPRYAAGIERERWTQGMLEAIEENYEPAHTHAGTVVYRPKTR
jgi:ABC-type glycerol-3-phosphate transport system permease component